MATTKLYLDTRGSAGENGSVKVVISHNRKSAYMNLGLKAPIAISSIAMERRRTSTAN